MGTVFNSADSSPRYYNTTSTFRTLLVKSTLALCGIFYLSPHGFSQNIGDIPPSGGGGGSNFSISVEPVEGLDELTTYHYSPLTQTISPANWTQDWTENFWRLNGQSFSLGSLGMAPSAPAGNDPSVQLPLQMSSNGTQKIKVQYLGHPDQMPSEIGLVINSSAQSHFGPDGSGESSNGLGDNSVYVEPFSQFSVVGLAGQISTGTHLRIMKLNSSGYGEFLVSSSANSNGSGWNPKVWAAAQMLSARVDPRAIFIGSASFPGPYTKAGAVNNIEKTFSATYPNGVVVLKTWGVKRREILPVTTEYPSFVSSRLTIDVGIPKFKRVAHQTGDTIGELAPAHFVAMATPGHYYNPGLSEASPILYNWLTSLAFPSIPQSGQITLATTSLALTGQFWKPVDNYISQSEYIGTWSGPDIGSSDSTEFKVSWPDGVKGQAELKINWHHLKENLFTTSEHQFLHPNIPWGVMQPVSSPYVVEGDWIKETGTHLFWSVDSPQMIDVATQHAGSAQVATAVGSSLISSHAILKAALSAISAGIGFSKNWILTNRTVSVLRGDYQVMQFITGDEHHFTANPDSYQWKVLTQRFIVARVHCEDNYGSSGFLGTSDDPEGMLVPESGATKKLLVRLHSYL